MKRQIGCAVFFMLMLLMLAAAPPVSAHAANYDMYITNVRVCDENKDDVLGNGVFCFDGDHTLIVRGNCETETLPIIASAIPDLVIRVASDSVLRSVEAPAIVANADLCILGPGSLELSSTKSCGIYLYGCGGELRNLTVHASGTWGIAGDKPDDGKEYLHIRNAEIIADGTKGAVCDFGGGIVLMECALEGGSIGASAIVDDQQQTATQVTVRRTGPDIPRLFTVSFHNARGGNPQAQLVDDGGLAREPRGLRAEDYTFTGWYTDAACRNRFDFSSPIRSDLALYSGWEYTPAVQAVDKTALDAAVGMAEALPSLDFSGETVPSFRAALAHARGVLEAGDAAQETVDDALLSLKTAMAALRVRDLSALRRDLYIAEQIETGRFTEETAAAMARAEADAKAALNADNQAEIDAAAAALEAALAALVAKPAVDRSGLEQALSDVPALEAGRYTEASVSVLAEALLRAAAALTAGSQAVVDAAADALRQAVGALAEKPAQNPFTDVSADSFCYAPVLWAVGSSPQITNGTGPAVFSPDAPCTRGQVVTFLWRSQGCPEPSASSNSFTDVKEGAFYCKAVAWAVEQGITNGMDTSHFAPDQACTRGQVVTFLWRAAHQPKPESADNPFVDVKDGYYADAVAWAVAQNITVGTDDAHFSPDATCTRGQIVTFLYRAAAK